jgi:uncharacterized protein (DUF433 family)
MKPRVELINQPLYTLAEAARYSRLPEATLRSWVAGRAYPTRQGAAKFRPLIITPSGSSGLSFVNLIEVHVLRAIRRRHKILMPQVRSAIDWVGRELGSDHPLAQHTFETDGKDLFVRQLNRLLNASQRGQGGLQEVLGHFLKRVEYDSAGLPRLFFPFTRSSEEDAVRTIVMDPAISAGRPIIHRTRVTTSILAERYTAGEGVLSLAAEYEIDVSAVEEAIRCEFPWAA